MRAGLILAVLYLTFVDVRPILSAATGGDDPNPATIPIVDNVPRHQEFLALAAKGNIDLLFIGDSITQRWNDNQYWQQYYAPLKAANFGINGNQTGHVLWRITDGKELDGIAPKVAVLLIGTNNTGIHSAQQIAGAIGLIIKTIQNKCPKTKVLLLGLFPRGEQPNTPIRTKIADINKIIAKLDDGGNTVRYLEFGQKFLQADGTLTQDIMPDFVHPSLKGYGIWAEAMNPTLNAMLYPIKNVRSIVVPDFWLDGPEIARNDVWVAGPVPLSQSAGQLLKARYH